MSVDNANQLCGEGEEHFLLPSVDFWPHQKAIYMPDWRENCCSCLAHCLLKSEVICQNNKWRFCGRHLQCWNCNSLAQIISNPPPQKKVQVPIINPCHMHGNRTLPPFETCLIVFNLQMIYLNLNPALTASCILCCIRAAWLQYCGHMMPFEVSATLSESGTRPLIGRHTELRHNRIDGALRTAVLKTKIAVFNTHTNG